MREIKFRAWDKKLECWADLARLHANQTIGLRYIKDGNNSIFDLKALATRLEFMQYTGLLDKNGKEIYEGDIIPNNANEKGVTVFDNGSFCWQYPDKSDTWSLVGIDIKDWEVIGNIYENPELLEPKSEELAS